MENSQISEITYYVQYILIVTLVMTNFADTIRNDKRNCKQLSWFSKFTASDTNSSYDNHSGI